MEIIFVMLLIVLNIFYLYLKKELSSLLIIEMIFMYPNYNISNNLLKKKIF